MATVRDPAADARPAPHTTPPLDAEPAVDAPTAFHSGRSRLGATLHAAAPLDAGTAVVEHAAVRAPPAVPIRGCPGGGVRHGPRTYDGSGRTARSPHIV
jgi:hypothetical protein